jgi:hypothetical protein
MIVEMALVSIPLRLAITFNRLFFLLCVCTVHMVGWLRLLLTVNCIRLLRS